LQRGLLVKKAPPLPAEAARVGMAPLLPTHIPLVIFFYGSTCTFLSGLVVSVMFKYIIKVNVGVGANGPGPRGSGYRLAFALAPACPVGRLGHSCLHSFPLASKWFSSGLPAEA